jgi:hypothetical protein
MWHLLITIAVASLWISGTVAPSDRKPADQPIRGVVIDSNQHKPVSRASIRAWRGGSRRCSPSPDFAALADSAGRFEVHLPGPGHYFLCAGAIGYAWRSVSVTMPRDSARFLSIRLPETPYFMGP